MKNAILCKVIPPVLAAMFFMCAARAMNGSIGETPPTYDLTLTVLNAAGNQALADAVVEIFGPVSMTAWAVGGVVSLTGLPSGVYTINVKWASPITGNMLVDVGSFTRDISVFKAEPDLLCKVYDITIRVSDTKGRLVSDAKIVISSAEASTDVMGTALFALVPEGSYSLKVEKEGSDLGASPSSIGVSASELDFAIKVGKIYDLLVRVVGEAGQRLPYSTIYVKDAKGTVSAYTTDASGAITIPELLEGTYEVTAEYGGFVSDPSRTISVNREGIVEEFKLPPYAEVFGVTFTYWTFLVIIIGPILFVVVAVVAVLVFRLARSRSRSTVSSIENK